ncbi:hypothetical protein K438DRAFT_70936 [Mycena galopus ATCC 62051]|nr:hypothetical protein K438DRAFT_70936 [Mycena galopus ATCC 62051]
MLEEMSHSAMTRAPPKFCSALPRVLAVMLLAHRSTTAFTVGQKWIPRFNLVPPTWTIPHVCGDNMRFTAFPSHVNEISDGRDCKMHAGIYNDCGSR